MLIETEATPNPATLKFNPGRMVGGDRTHQFSDRSAAAGSPLARRLFAIDQITAVFFGPDFITATKTDAVDWPTVKPAVFGAIMEHYVTGDPLFDVETVDTGHSVSGEEGGAKGPVLYPNPVVVQKGLASFSQWVLNPSSVKKGTTMPALNPQLTDVERNKVTGLIYKYLVALNRKAKKTK